MSAINPTHYTSGDVECIDAIKSMLSAEEYQGFLRGSAFKYQWRLGLKGDASEDTAKALWYLVRLKAYLGG
jgi:hypothetical protein